MNPELIARISPEHRRRLAWFEEHQGEVSAIPGPLADGLLLVSKPKGIYKPADLPYALSIRINLDSPYADGVPVPTPGGGWLLSYHQENADPADRDTMFTNRGLMQCIADRVPVGVLRERAPAGRHSQYDVLGLALPVRWSDGYFFFESLNPPAVPVIDPVSDVLEATARAELDQETPPGGEGLDDDYDARLRVYRQIVARRGQPGFRAALLEAYQRAVRHHRLRRARGPGSCPPAPVPRTRIQYRHQRAAAAGRHPHPARSPPAGPRPGDPDHRRLQAARRNPIRGTHPPASSLTRQQHGNARTKRPWRSSGSASATPKTTGSSDDLVMTTRAVQGMARVRSGQAPAWPLSSDRSVRRGSRVKRDFACTFARHFPPVLVALRSQSRLRLEGRTRTLSGPSPEIGMARALCAFASHGMLLSRKCPVVRVSVLRGTRR